MPQFCAEMVRPSGVFTETALNFGSCARPGAETAAAITAAIMNVRTMDLLRVGMYVIAELPQIGALTQECLSEIAHSEPAVAMLPIQESSQWG